VKSMKPEVIRQQKPMPMEELQSKLEEHMFAYHSTSATQSFANFIITRLLQSKSDLAFVERELIAMWSSTEYFKERELLMSVYYNFLNDIYPGAHLNFFV
jgi:hypothetical protein